METFRTIVNVVKSSNEINYKSKIMLLGSCFTEHIGNKLNSLLFQTSTNFFGIIYNPISVKNSLEILLDNRVFKQEDLEYNNERWFSFNHHSKFSNVDVDACLQDINHSINEGYEIIKNANFLFITFGTARVFRLKKSGKIVSNCHKLSSNLFQNDLLSVNEIVEEYSSLINVIKEINNNVKIVFTVSPVRHWKDGAHENQVSKSILLLAIDSLVSNFENVDYFPAYEIFMDDLRDYRFFAEDMLHPNEIGINYVWDKFVDSFFSEETKQISDKISSLNKAKNHRVFNPESNNYKKFLLSNLKKIDELEKLNLDINLGELKSQFMEKQRKF